MAYNNYSLLLIRTYEVLHSPCMDKFAVSRSGLVLYSRRISLFGSLFFLVSCSTYLITSGVLDEPDQKVMLSANTRQEFESVAGTPTKSKTTPKGNKVDLYEYVDGEAGVIGSEGRPMSGERGGRAIATAITVGLFEILMVPTALSERSEAMRRIYVVYSLDDSILAICPNKYTDEQDTLCDSEILPAHYESYNW
jgi:hypothetical protein